MNNFPSIPKNYRFVFSGCGNDFNSYGAFYAVYYGLHAVTPYEKVFTTHLLYVHV